jgi:hypothetical protein
MTSWKLCSDLFYNLLLFDFSTLYFFNQKKLLKKVELIHKFITILEVASMESKQLKWIYLVGLALIWGVHLF